MSHTKKPTIEKIILALLGLLALAALVRTMFLGLEIDEEYALSLGFRLVRGEFSPAFCADVFCFGPFSHKKRKNRRSVTPRRENFRGLFYSAQGVKPSLPSTWTFV